ncbi:hypothetical protein FIE12Z_4844 [Fusarium flagelliforme]|uniref:Uncharacterized protein n=1 Tax=Fusarium flagelliforme TaxID=2675880 RepID=A0A395MSF7_9HYPO|nr:hypothetical protein FIE12Z_4844 [Fusarium flagelliforme]
MSIDFGHNLLVIPRVIVERYPEFAALFVNNHLSWHNLSVEQSQIVTHYLNNGTYYSARPTRNSTMDPQRLSLHDAIYVQAQAQTHFLPGLASLCCLEMGRIAYNMPILYFAWCLGHYRTWIEVNRDWITPFMHQRLRTRIPPVVTADMLHFQLDDPYHYTLMVALINLIYILREWREQSRR